MLFWRKPHILGLIGKRREQRIEKRQLAKETKIKKYKYYETKLPRYLSVKTGNLTGGCPLIKQNSAKSHTPPTIYTSGFMYNYSQR